MINHPHNENTSEQSDRLFRVLIEQSSDIFVLVNAQGQITYISPSVTPIMGYTPDELPGRQALEFVHTEDLMLIQEKLKQLLHAPGQRMRAEYRLRCKDGTWRWFEAVATNLLHEAGVEAIVKSFRDITERKQIEEKRIALEQRKNDFISLAGHELKTPLTSLKGYVQLLQKKIEQQDSIDYAFFLLRINRQINRLIKLVHDLVDVNRAQTGNLNYTKEIFALDDLVEEIREMLQGDSHHQLIFENRTPLQIYGDRDRIGQVLINLLNNAIKYSPHADKVFIRIERENTEAVVSIQDSGIGIAQEDQEKVFQRFYRVHDAEQNIFPGMGIGLYISHEIIQRHRGQLWVQSKKGEGATFGFRLPLHRLEHN